LREVHISPTNESSNFFIFQKFVLKAFSNSDVAHSFRTFVINEIRVEMHFHLSESTCALQSWTRSNDSCFIHFFLLSADQTMESIHSSWKL